MGKNAVVVDAGANLGNFSKAISQFFHCRCIAIEPVQKFYDQIPETQHIQKFMGILYHHTKTQSFFISSGQEASSIFRDLSVQSGGIESATITQSITLMDLMQLYDIKAVDVLKMDIEGAEIDVLDGLSDSMLEGIGQLVIEFHDFVLPYQRPDIQRIIQRLEKLGFVTIRASRNHFMDMVFINKKRHSLSLRWKWTYSALKTLSLRLNS